MLEKDPSINEVPADLMSAEEKAIDHIAQDLFLAMPGSAAKLSPTIRMNWDDARNTEHFAFCETIAWHIVRLSDRTFVDPD